jgi:hypothetical protein
VKRQLFFSLLCLSAAIGCALLAGCAGGQTDDSSTPGTKHCSESPRLEYALEGELAARVAALEGSYDEPLFWVDDAAWGEGIHYSPNGRFVDSTQAESVSRLHAEITATSDTVVSFEDCIGTLGGVSQRTEWVPIAFEVWSDDGVIDDRAELWLQLDTDSLNPPSNALTIAPGWWISPSFDDPEHAGARLVLKAAFADGRMDGFLERTWPDAGDPGQWAPEPVRGHFPAACLEAEDQLPIADALHGMSPRDGVAVLAAMPEFELDWGDGHVAALRIAVEPGSETACHNRFSDVDGGRAELTADVTFTTPDGERLTSTQRAAVVVTLAPEGCGSLTPLAPLHAPAVEARCQGELVQSIGAGSTRLEISDPAGFLGGALAEDATLEWATLQLQVRERGDEWVYEVRVGVGSNAQGESLRQFATATGSRPVR